MADGVIVCIMIAVIKQGFLSKKSNDLAKSKIISQI